jgi:hypothetical protein
MSDIPDSLRRKLTQIADLFPVPIDLVCVIDRRHQDGQLLAVGRRWFDVDVATVPGETGVGRMGLGAPGVVRLDLLPL